MKTVIILTVIIVSIIVIVLAWTAIFSPFYPHPVPDVHTLQTENAPPMFQDTLDAYCLDFKFEHILKLVLIYAVPFLIVALAAAVYHAWKHVVGGTRELYMMPSALVVLASMTDILGERASFWHRREWGLEGLLYGFLFGGVYVTDCIDTEITMLMRAEIFKP